MGLISNIVCTLAPLVVGVVVFGIGYFAGNRASKPKPKPENNQKNGQNAGSPKVSETVTEIYRREDRKEDLEVDGQHLEEDAVPPLSASLTVPNRVLVAEIHDAIILHAEEDDALVKQFIQDLLSNVEMTGLNVVMYEEFAPEIQSHFRTMDILFQRCRYLFVVVTKNFTDDSLKKFQHEIALMDSIRNPEKSERIIPVWAENGADGFLCELAVFKGIEYMPQQSFSEKEKEMVFKKFKKVFENGRKIIQSPVTSGNQQCM